MPPEARTDSIEQLAADLRALRSRAGDPTLVALARRTGISKSVLSDAFVGRRLPTERTVVAVVGEFGGDTEAFAARRSALDVPVREGASAGAAPGGPASAGGGSGPRTVRLTAALWIAVGAAVVGMVSGATAATVVQQRGAASPAEAEGTGSASPSATAPAGARVVVTSGLDPAQTACVDDAAVAASETRSHDTLLEIIWSDACQAGWARVTRYDAAAVGNAVSASIFREVAPDAPDRQDTTEPGVQSAYTTLIVRPTPDTRVCATGEITLDGEHLDLGEPICL